MSICGKYLISLRQLLIFGLFAGTGFVVSENGGQSSSSPDNETLCDFMDRTHTKLQRDISLSFPDWLTNCSVLDSCQALNCSIKVSGSELKGGFHLDLCKTPTSVTFWKGSFWSRAFVVTDKLEPERVEIDHQENMAPNEGFMEEAKKWFLTVHLRQASTSPLVTLRANLDICDKTQDSKSSAVPHNCSTILFINRTTFDLSRVCELAKFEGRGTQWSSLLAAPAPHSLDDIHRSGQIPFRSISSHIGQECNPSNPFYCGNGATCRETRENVGVCECLVDYENSTDGCVHKKKPDPSPSPNDADTDDSDENSSSAAIGAVLSVIVLISLAGFIFLGTKYHIFSRLRNRYHYIRCWPFGRGRSSIDHVSMVNPISTSEDDEPPLL